MAEVEVTPAPEIAAEEPVKESPTKDREYYVIKVILCNHRFLTSVPEINTNEDESIFFAGNESFHLAE